MNQIDQLLQNELEEEQSPDLQDKAFIQTQVTNPEENKNELKSDDNDLILDDIIDSADDPFLSQLGSILSESEQKEQQELDQLQQTPPPLEIPKKQPFEYKKEVTPLKDIDFTPSKISDVNFDNLDDILKQVDDDEELMFWDNKISLNDHCR